MQSAMARMRTIAEELHTPIANVVSGFEGLVASGKSVDEALALIGSVSATAHAADADTREIATTADAISAAFGIAANRMSGAFDIIAHGGKMGKFELKDMASELPSLAPAFAALGYTGEEGLKRLTAALQTVRMEVGTSGEAATSFMDVISKMETDTVSNNFKKFKIDIRSAMRDARRNGEDTLLAFIRLSREAVGGDLSKLPQLFTDKQMLVGMRALINNTGEYTASVEKLGDAVGTVLRDNQRLAKDTKATLDDMVNSWDRMWSKLGGAAAPAVKPLLDTVGDAANEIMNRQAEDDVIKAYAEKKGLSSSERWRLLMPGYWPGLGDKVEDEKWRAGALWEMGHRTEAQRKMIAEYGKQGWTDTPERDPSLGPEVRDMPQVGPVPRFFRDADGNKIGTAAAPLPAAAAPAIPLPRPRPTETDLAIDARDAERAAVARELAREGMARHPGAANRELEAAFPDGRRAALDDFLVPPQVFAPAPAPPPVAPVMNNDALADAAPRIGAAIGDGAMERMRALGAMAGLSFGERRTADPLQRDMAGDHPQPAAMQNVGDLLRSLEDAGSAVGTDLARGGEDAASAMTSAAPQVGDAIGGSAMSRMRAEGAAIGAAMGAAMGEAVAAKIRAATVNVKVQGPARGVSGNPGAAFPNAGEAGVP